MIRVTVWYEQTQELGAAGVVRRPEMSDADYERVCQWADRNAEEIRKVHPNGLHNTLKAIFEEEEDMVVRTVTLGMPECGLTQEVLDDTDVLVWWAHVAHDRVPDEIVKRVKDAVLKGMGFIGLHSAHPSKPMQAILGTSGRLQWREGDRSRVWCTCPTHPIAKGIPESFELADEEMYGEYFDIPKPDDLVFVSWFAGGEVFRSGCTWTRGMGRIFYFQPGHETQPSYYVPEVRQILKNAVRWAAPTVRVDNLNCPHAAVAPEAKYREGK